AANHPLRRVCSNCVLDTADDYRIVGLDGVPGAAADHRVIHVRPNLIGGAGADERAAGIGTNHVWRATKTAATDDVATRPWLLNSVVVEPSDQVPRERAARVRLQTQHAHSVAAQLECLIIRRAQERSRDGRRASIAAELPEFFGFQAA